MPTPADILNAGVKSTWMGLTGWQHADGDSCGTRRALTVAGASSHIHGYLSLIPSLRFQHRQSTGHGLQDYPVRSRFPSKSDVSPRRKAPATRSDPGCATWSRTSSMLECDTSPMLWKRLCARALPSANDALDTDTCEEQAPLPEPKLVFCERERTPCTRSSSRAAPKVRWIPLLPNSKHT